MVDLVEAFYHIKYNPFKYGGLFCSFYSGISNVEDSLLLAPLVIPLCTHPVYGKVLSNSVFGENRKSTMWSIFSDRQKLYDLQERFDAFKPLTDQSIQYCIVNEWLDFSDDYMSLIYCGRERDLLKDNRNALKLGKLFSGFQIAEIYSILGVFPR